MIYENNIQDNTDSGYIQNQVANVSCNETFLGLFAHNHASYKQMILYICF